LTGELAATTAYLHRINRWAGLQVRGPGTGVTAKCEFSGRTHWTYGGRTHFATSQITSDHL